jgi:hypothetical protein
MSVGLSLGFLFLILILGGLAAFYYFKRRTGRSTMTAYELRRSLKTSTKTKELKEETRQLFF